GDGALSTSAGQSITNGTRRRGSIPRCRIEIDEATNATKSISAQRPRGNGQHASGAKYCLGKIRIR
ncbi:MAG: hypothetical protein WCC99_03830, partial [Candidatus Sulfotelmatobacter sp.]